MRFVEAGHLLCFIHPKETRWICSRPALYRRGSGNWHQAFRPRMQLVFCFTAFRTDNKISWGQPISDYVAK